MKNIFIYFLLLIFCLGTTCKENILHESDGSSSPIKPAIVNANTNATQALIAAEKKFEALSNQTSVAAAQVTSIAVVNSNQPPSVVTQIVKKEAELALNNLPPPNQEALIEAEKRRSLMLAGKFEEAQKLYEAAQAESQKIKAENEKLRIESENLKIKMEAAQKNLIEVEKKWEAQLRENAKVSQEKIEQLIKAAQEAEKKAYEERHKLIFRWLVGLGVACVAASIALAAVTNGTMIAKSIIIALGGALSIGIAQILSHPWFNIIFGICIFVIVVGLIVYFIYERKIAHKNETLNRVVDVIQNTDATSSIFRNTEGKEQRLGDLFSKKMDDTHKKIIKSIKLNNEIRNVKNK